MKKYYISSNMSFNIHTVVEASSEAEALEEAKARCFSDNHASGDEEIEWCFSDCLEDIDVDSSNAECECLSEDDEEFEDEEYDDEE